ncbi:MAG: hypothetical protein LUH46_02570 [Alistipes sp.]|nr:hypothetical protein [Alistipes sp.]
MFAFVQTAFTYTPDLTWQQIAANAGWSDAQPAFYHKLFCKYIERLLPADGSPILDIGCGNGFTANYLAGKGYDVRHRRIPAGRRCPEAKASVFSFRGFFSTFVKTNQATR